MTAYTALRGPFFIRFGRMTFSQKDGVFDGVALVRLAEKLLRAGRRLRPGDFAQGDDYASRVSYRKAFENYGVSMTMCRWMENEHVGGTCDEFQGSCTCGDYGPPEEFLPLLQFQE